MMSKAPVEIGAAFQEDGRCQFTLWGPELDSVELQVVSPQPQHYPLLKDNRGWWSTTVEDIAEGYQYRYCINESNTWPDPASRYQPEGVHGPSVVVDQGRFNWLDQGWQNLPLQDYIIYELHIGTFTPEGTFKAAIERLADLKALGVTAIEIMPVAQFPGDHNWGYDGAYPYAVQHSYGGPVGLKQFVDACHQQGLAVILDVVYNHFGPEGNYSGCYAPFITERYKTPWGGAINYDDAWCDGVRQFFIQNVVFWLRDYHIDGLRLDAIHAIFDFGAQHVLAAMAKAVTELSQQTDKPYYLIAESDLNDTRIIRTPELGGYGIDAQWSDDFHHALHTLLTGEAQGYYQDFGTCGAFGKALGDRFVYDGSYSAFRRRSHGDQAIDLPSTQFVVCSQNHDQVGNRMLGERLSQLVSFEALKLAAGATLLSPYIPLLFMGEEYGETAPFLYFIDHGDPALVKAVRQGRKEEFKDFHAVGEPLPPDTLDTFKRSQLDWTLRHQGQHQTLWRYYQKLLAIRKTLGLGRTSFATDLDVVSDEAPKVVSYQRRMPDGLIFCMMNFNQQAVTIEVLTVERPWQLIFDSAASEWDGPGGSLLQTIAVTQKVSLSPLSLVLYRQA